MHARALALTLMTLVTSCRHELVMSPSEQARVGRDVVQVMGSGEAEGAPDIVRLSLGVEARGSDVQQAVEQVNGKMRAVLDALRGQGVEPKDVQTQQLNIHSEERAPEPPEPLPMPAPAPVSPKGARPGAPPTPPPGPVAPVAPPIIYRVSNGVMVTLRDVKRVGAAVGAAVHAGANQAWGIEFDVDDKKALLAEAQRRAMEDARQRAQHLAATSGVKLGRIVSITEADARDVPGPVPMAMQAYSRAQADVPMEAGTLRVQQSIKVVYEIKR